jgi:hypothetical protein
MYTWIWRKLPGGPAGKLAGTVVLLAAAVAVLFLVVFPWVGPKLPFNHVTVDTPTTVPSIAPSHASAPGHSPRPVHPLRQVPSSVPGTPT